MYMLAKESLETILRRPAILFCVHDDFFPLYLTMQVCVLMSKLNDYVLPGEIQEATTKTIEFASKN